MDSIIVAFGVLVVIIVVLAIFFSFFPVGLWISALASGVKIRISTLVGMRIRRITPSRLVYPLIKATKAGLDVSIDKMEAHYLAGGNIDRVINALIAAQRADIDLVFERAAAIDLAAQARRPLSPVSAKASSPPSVPRNPTSRFSKIPI